MRAGADAEVVAERPVVEVVPRALAGAAIAQDEEVAREQLPFEFMLNALRLIEGFPVALFTRRTGLPITAIGPELERAEAAGLIARDHATIRPTGKGQRFLNDLLEIFLPAPGARATVIPISTYSPGTSRPS